MSYLDPDLSGPWAAVLEDRYARAAAEDLLGGLIGEVFPGRIALVSSFGAESAVLLHMVSRIDPNLPVIFLDTDKLFGETLRYRDRLVERLALTNLQIVRPDPDRLRAEDPKGLLWASKPNACCYWRKVEPLERALTGYRAWITGRKRIHGGERSDIARIEAADKRVRVSPLADWTRDDIEAYFSRHHLPRHPLEADGYLSIGCMPCTDRVAESEDIRAGRWRGLDKLECGIHLGTAEARRRAAL